MAKKLGQLHPFYSCIPTGIHGPTCFFWANLTPFSLCSGAYCNVALVTYCEAVQRFEAAANGGGVTLGGGAVTIGINLTVTLGQ